MCCDRNGRTPVLADTSGSNSNSIERHLESNVSRRGWPFAAAALSVPRLDHPAVLIWFLVAGPIIVAALCFSNEFEAGIVVEGIAALLLTLGFIVRGSWRANGLGGGVQLRWWHVLWPIWIVAVPTLALYASQRSLNEHLLMLALCILVGFTEEAIFRGIMLRKLLPGGTRSAILWSAIWFGALHLMGAFAGLDGRMVLLLAAFAFAMGLVYAWVRFASASIWPALVAHCFLDYSALIESGSLREAMRYSTHDAALTAVFTILLLAWAWRLMFHEAWCSVLADPTTELA